MARKNGIIYSAILAGMMACSCQNVIDIDLNEADPVLVVDASISDKAGPHQIILTSTVNFDEANEFPGASGALVTVADEAGDVQLFTETSPGVYTSTATTFITGKKYKL